MRILPLLLILLGACAERRFQRQLLPDSLPPIADLSIDDSHAMALDEQRRALLKEYFALHVPGNDFAPQFQMEPTVVVVHYTAIPTLEKTLQVFKAPTIDAGRGQVRAAGAANVGIQFVVDREGTIYALFPETTMARHCIGLNHTAIGIENVGSSDISRSALRGAPCPPGSLTPAQLAANVRLISVLANRHPSLRWVIGHSEYRDFEHPAHPARSLFREAIPDYRTEKVDPGRRFMKALRRRLKRLALGQETRLPEQAPAPPLGPPAS
jgi:N-acetyl-anhydromuramyl-L-alanine amidase AmpD